MDITKQFKKLPLEEIKKIKPLWHTDLLSIDLSLQPDQVIDELITNGFHIYKSSWHDLNLALEPGYKKIYANKKLWNNFHYHDKIALVLKNWVNKVPLIPPMLIDSGYDSLVPADGKHRTKVSSILDEDELIFILFDNEISTIQKYFKPILIE